MIGILEFYPDRSRLLSVGGTYNGILQGYPDIVVAKPFSEIQHAVLCRQEFGAKTFANSFRGMHCWG